MRPETERAGGGSGARPTLWHTPTPYLFLGFTLMMGLIAVALLVLICTRRKPSPRRSDSPVRVLVPLDREPKVVVIMAGDDAPSFLACAKPLGAFVPTGAEKAADGV